MAVDKDGSFCLVKTKETRRVEKGQYCPLPLCERIGTWVETSGRDKRRTTEVVRVSSILLEGVFIGKITPLLPTVKLTLGKIIFAKGFLTRHWMERVDVYTNRLSLCGTYTEVLPAEVDLLRNIHTTLCDMDQQQWDTTVNIVEIGFNFKRQICKIGFTVQLNTTENKDDENKRILFICMAVNGGFKTFYIIPNKKHGIRGGKAPQFHSKEEMLNWMKAY
jgi:hypothetical protein